MMMLTRTRSTQIESSPFIVRKTTSLQKFKEINNTLNIAHSINNYIEHLDSKVIPLLRDVSGTTYINEEQIEIAPVDVMRAIPFGRFHWILIIVHFMMYISSSFILYNMGFLQMGQVYQCSLPQSGNS